MERETIEYQKTVEVGKSTYKITVLPPSRALKLLASIFKLIGEPFAHFAVNMKAAKTEDEAKSEAMKALPMAVKALVSRLDEDEILKIVKDLVATASYDNKALDFERHFQGRLGELTKLLYKIVEVQYEDFIEALGSMIGE